MLTLLRGAGDVLFFDAAARSRPARRCTDRHHGDPDFARPNPWRAVAEDGTVVIEIKPGPFGPTSSWTGCPRKAPSMPRDLFNGRSAPRWARASVRARGRVGVGRGWVRGSGEGSGSATPPGRGAVVALWRNSFNPGGSDSPPVRPFILSCITSSALRRASAWRRHQQVLEDFLVAGLDQRVVDLDAPSSRPSPSS